MTVESVNEPKKTQTIDPKTQAEKKDESTQYWENATKSTRARREFIQEQKMMQDIQNPPKPPEPPFKVTGGINMGNIDLQEQQREAKEEARRQQEEAQRRIDEAERQRNEAREALNEAQIKHVQESLTGQIDQLKQAILAGNKRDITTELESIEGIAAKLGLKRASLENGNGNIDAQIALKRLEQEMKREDRRFALEMKKDERMWQMELKKLEQNARESEARLQAENNKYQMLANIPQQLGSSIAKGLMAREEAGGGGGSINRAPSAPSAPQMRTIEAGEGEAGQITCPTCNHPVGIGPTSQRITCATPGCGQRFVVNRIPMEPEPEPGVRGQPPFNPETSDSEDRERR